MELEKAEATRDNAGSKASDPWGRIRALSLTKKKGDSSKISGENCAPRPDVPKVSSARLFKFGISTAKTPSSKPTKVKLFGVDLKDVLDRNPSIEPKYPGVPKFLNDVLSFVEKEYEPGLNFYRGTSQFRSKIDQTRHSLNYGEVIELQEPRVAAGVVKLFLRELPTHVLGSALEAKIEETKPTEKRSRKIQSLYQKGVPEVNKALFERFVLHMEIIGVDLTSLLRTSQKALSMLKPVLRPWSLNDELRVEEARLARMHFSLAKTGTTKAKSKTKQNQDQDRLWEAQRNVTQLKRKLKQSASLKAASIEEPLMNLRERAEKEDPPETSATTEAADRGEVGTHSSGEPQNAPAVPQLEAGIVLGDAESREKSREVANVKKSVSEGERLCDRSNSELNPTDIEDDERKDALSPSQSEGSAPGAVEDRVTKPTGATESKEIRSEPTTRGCDDSPECQIGECLDLKTRKSLGESAAQRSLPETGGLEETPTTSNEKSPDGEELSRLQQEWKEVVGEQIELIRMRDDLRRRIRDEHKQIKMIQMVRNHRSRLNCMKPAYLVSLENMSTAQLSEALRQLIESNTKLTQDAQMLADKVFGERMGLVNLRNLNAQSLLG